MTAFPLNSRNIFNLKPYFEFGRKVVSDWSAWSWRFNYATLKMHSCSFLLLNSLLVLSIPHDVYLCKRPAFIYSLSTVNKTWVRPFLTFHWGKQLRKGKDKCAWWLACCHSPAPKQSEHESYERHTCAEKKPREPFVLTTCSKYNINEVNTWESKIPGVHSIDRALNGASYELQ